MKSPELTETRTYFQKYIDVYEDDTPSSVLENSLDEMVAVLKNLGNAECEQSYAPGKWTIKEVLGHIIETERVFAYRALRFARNDSQKLSPFDQDTYVDESEYNNRALIDIVFEFMTVRNASISLFKYLKPNELNRTGSWSDSDFSVREIAQIIAGHGKHHMDVIVNKYL